MRDYLIKRFFLMLITMFGITVISFGIIHLAPGDPAALKAQAGEGLQDQAMAMKIVEQTRRLYHLDKPILLNLQVFRAEQRVAEMVDFLQQQHESAADSSHWLTDIVTWQEIRKRVGQASPVSLAGLMAKLQNQELPREIRVEILDFLIDDQRITISPRAKFPERLERVQSWWQTHPERHSYSQLQKTAMIVTNAQYGLWVGRMLHLDFGHSLRDKRPVLELILERIPISIGMAIASVFLAYLVAIPIGIFSATHQYSFWDRFLTVLLFVLYSAPSFWVATMGIVLLGGGDFWDVIPVFGIRSLMHDQMSFTGQMLDYLQHLAFPIFVYSYASFAALSRYMRTGMLETVRQDFIMTARAKGLSERVVIFKHALRNSVIPIITLMSSILPLLIGGSVIIETIFSIPGMGFLSYNSILARDYPVIMAIFTISSFLSLLGILVSDILYTLVDPRISFSGRTR